MKVVVIELVENNGSESQVAQVCSSMAYAKKWMEKTGMFYGEFSGDESFAEAHYSVLEYTVDGDENDFEGFGNFTTTGKEFDETNS